MDFDYHDSFQRLAVALRDEEREAYQALMESGDELVEQSKSLNFEKDLRYSLAEYSKYFASPNDIQFTPSRGDEVNYLFIPKSLF